MFSRAEKIVTSSWKIISVREKTVSLTNLIFDVAQIAGSYAWKIADDPKMIVFMKGKTTASERRSGHVTRSLWMKLSI